MTIIISAYAFMTLNFWLLVGLRCILLYSRQPQEQRHPLYTLAMVVCLPIVYDDILVNA